MAESTIQTPELEKQANNNVYTREQLLSFFDKSLPLHVELQENLSKNLIPESFIVKEILEPRVLAGLPVCYLCFLLSSL